MIKYLILFVFFIPALYAAQFVPIKIDAQLKESDAVIRGIYKHGNVKKHPGDNIVTSHYFELLEVAGVEQNEIFNLNAFEVYTPGGLYNGRHVHVSGTPTFQKGEEVVLLLKRTQFGWTVQNFALGKYQVVWDKRKRVLRSSVFPIHPGLGYISYNNFQTEVIKQLGQAMVKPTPDNYIHKTIDQTVVIDESAKEEGRQPASVKKTDKAIQESSTELMWLALLLGILGSLMTWYHRRSENEDY